MPTSVPVWETTAPEVDLTGRSYAVLAVGPEGAAVAAVWLRDLGPLGVPVARVELTDAGTADPVAWASDQARDARVGWRFAVAGPEDVVLQACAAVRALGAVDAEITAHATSAATQRVWCAHCRTTTATTVGVGALAGCGGCGAELLVYAHLSRHHGSYLGFRHDAEELP